jgi:hypothetical protein
MSMVYCVSSLAIQWYIVCFSEEEGEQGVQDMKLRFSANVNLKEALSSPDLANMVSKIPTFYTI